MSQHFETRRDWSTLIAIQGKRYEHMEVQFLQSDKLADTLPKYLHKGNQEGGKDPDEM